MNIELDAVVVMDISDDALELAAGGAQGGPTITPHLPPVPPNPSWQIGASFCYAGNPLGY